MLERIKEESKGRLILCFAGVGAASAKKNSQTSLIIAKNGVTILVDMGGTIPGALYQQGIPVFAFDFYHNTHSHGDHAFGYEELVLQSRYVKKQRPKLIITESYYDILWDKTLRGSCEHNEADLLKFSDLVIPVKPDWVQAQPREIYQINIEGIDLLIFRTAHVPGNVDQWEKAYWSTGLIIDQKVLFTGDTRFDPLLFVHLPMEKIEAIFHDCQLFDPGTVHATYNELKTYPSLIKERMFLSHYGDNFEQFNPAEDGFRGFAKPWEIYRF